MLLLYFSLLNKFLTLDLLLQTCVSNSDLVPGKGQAIRAGPAKTRCWQLVNALSFTADLQHLTILSSNFHKNHTLTKPCGMHFQFQFLKIYCKLRYSKTNNWMKWRLNNPKANFQYQLPASSNQFHTAGLLHHHRLSCTIGQSHAYDLSFAFFDKAGAFIQ